MSNFLASMRIIYQLNQKNGQHNFDQLKLILVANLYWAKKNEKLIQIKTFKSSKRILWDSKSYLTKLKKSMKIKPRYMPIYLPFKPFSRVSHKFKSSCIP